MTPTEIKKTLSEEKAVQLYAALGDPKAAYNDVVAAIMFLQNVDEDYAKQVVDFNLSQFSQMEVDLEIREKLKNRS